MGLDMYLTRNNDVEVGYWRKANSIHKWFVKHVQKGSDNCARYRVSLKDLTLLKQTVLEVLENSKLVDGKVVNGYTFKDGQKIPMLEDGEIIEDSTVAEKLLPTESGFFFGSTDYDIYYYEDLENTVEIIDDLIATHTPGDTYYYQSSW